eukprot:1658138-Rhodomonas_salina.3
MRESERTTAAVVETEREERGTTPVRMGEGSEQCGDGWGEAWRSERMPLPSASRTETAYAVIGCAMPCTEIAYAAIGDVRR